MSMTRTCLISFAMLAMLAMGFQAPLIAPTDPDSTGEDVAGRVNVGGQGGYFRLNHVVGNGVGWNDNGYSQFGGWLPFTEFSLSPTCTASSHVESAVDAPGLAGDVTGGVLGEEGDEGADAVVITVPAETSC